MGPVILISSLMLAFAQGDSQATQPAPSDQIPTAPNPRARTGSPPSKKPPVDPKVNVDPGIQLPPNQLPQPPQSPAQPATPKDDSVKPKDDSVKPVQPAPSEPDKPGVRPL